MSVALAADGVAIQPPRHPMTPVPFKEAIAWAKGRGVVLPEVYYGELQGLARAMTFSIAGLAKLDQLQAVKDSLDANLAEGGTLREWQKRVKAGDIGLDLPAHRLENIYRTNIQGNYNRGRCEQQKRTAEAFPWLMYDAINDSRTRPAHAAMDGFVARHDDPLWKIWYPPCGYQSLLPGQTFAGAIETGLKAWYSGPAVEIFMESGSRFSVTAQHPVLSESGWIDAGDLSKGDDLLCYVGKINSIDCAVAPENQKQDMPLTAKEAFDSLASNGMVRVPRSAFDLNGDVVFIESDVDVVTANRHLMDALKSGIDKTFKKLGFKQPDAASVILPGGGAANSSLLAAGWIGPHSLGGNRRLHCETSDRIPSVSGVSGLLCVEYDPVLFQVSGQPLGVHVMGRSDSLEGLAASVSSDHVARDILSKIGSLNPNALGSSNGARFLSGSLEPRFRDVFVGGFGVNPHAASDLVNAHPGLVKADKVIDVRLFNWTGHVFDFQCANGLIIAQGGESVTHSPILSNCRCRVIALTDKQAARFQAADAKRMQDPELAAARASAKPDKGWDYSVCSDPTEGVRRAVEAKRPRTDHRLMAAHDEAVAVEAKRIAAVKAAIEAARDDCLAFGKANNRERMILIDDATGRELARADGAQSSVAFTGDMNRILQDPHNRVRIVHNHPSSGSLSLSDLIAVYVHKGASEIEAIGHDGSLYVGGAGGGGIADGVTYSAAIKAVQSAFMTEVVAGNMSAHQAGDMFWHATNTALAQAGIISYRAILSVRRQETLDGLGEAFDAAVKAAVAAIKKQAKP